MSESEIATPQEKIAEALRLARIDWPADDLAKRIAEALRVRSRGKWMRGLHRA